MTAHTEQQVRDELARVQDELDRLKADAELLLARLDSGDTELTEEECILLDAASRLIERKLFVRRRQRFIASQAA
jgi:hypothetical protein